MSFESCFDLVSIGLLASFINGDRGENYPKSTDYIENGVAFLSATDIGEGKIAWDKAKRISVGSYEKLRNGKVQRGDILFCLRGSLGKIGYVENEYKGAIASSLVIIRASDESLALYLRFILNSKEVQGVIKSLDNGSVQGNISAAALKNLLVPKPPEDIRRAIIRILGSIEERISLNRQINQTLEAMAQAIFKSWFVDFDPVKAKIAAIEAGQDPLRAAMSVISGKSDAELDAMPRPQYDELAATAVLFPEALVESELGDVPKGWSVGAFKECCLRVESGGTPSRKEPVFWGGSIPWLTSGEVRDIVVLDTKEKITKKGLDLSSAKLWPPMTTVVAMYGATAGQVCLITEEMTANQACCALIPRKEFQTFIFIAARQSIQQLAEKASGSAQQNLNKSLVEGHAHVIPTTQVAARFEVATGNLMKKWIVNQKEVVFLSQIRDTLLPKLLSGELSVAKLEEVV